MNLNELKEKLRADAQVTWEKFQDSPVYSQLKDRYDNLSPAMQKLAIFGSVALLLLVLLSTPMGSYTNAGIQEQEFLERRQLIRDFLKAQRSSQDLPNLPAAPPTETLRAQIQGQATMARLIPDQIGSVEEVRKASSLIADNLLSTQLQVSYKKLNLRQVIDLGTQLQNLSPSVKLKDMNMIASTTHPQYFDVDFLVAVLNLSPSEGGN